MERIPVWVLAVAALVFAGLGVWAATDENWSGLIVSALAVAALGSVAARRRQKR